MLYRSSASYVGVALSSLRVVVTVSPKFELKEVGRRIPWIKISTEVDHAMSKLFHIAVAKSKKSFVSMLNLIFPS